MTTEETQKRIQETEKRIQDLRETIADCRKEITDCEGKLMIEKNDLDILKFEVLDAKTKASK